MDDIIKVAIFIIALMGADIGAYAGVTVVSVMKRRFEGKLERADFAERMLVEKGVPERLSSGPVVDNQH